MTRAANDIRPIDTARRRAPAASRIAGTALLGAGVITLLGGLAQQLVGSSASDDVYRSPFSGPAFVVICLAAATSHALVCIGLRGLGRSRGLRIAFAATAAMILLELVGIPLRDQPDTDALPTAVASGFGFATVVFCGGLFLASRTSRDRRALLAWCGATIPLIVLAPTDFFGWGLVLWSLPMLLLGTTLLREGRPAAETAG